MLKKNQLVKFAKPMSTMRQVLSAVEHGFETRQSIVDETGLVLNKVRAALCNLTFIGAIQRIGLEAYEALESDNTPKKWTREELKEITQTYRRKLKELQG